MSISSPSVGYAYPLLSILYHGKPAIFLFCFTVFLSTYSCFCFVKRICCLAFIISATVERLWSEHFSKFLNLSEKPTQSPIFFFFLLLAIHSSSSICFVLFRMVVVFYSSTVVFTSLLFFFRTRAVFDSYPWIVAFFAFMWLVVLGGCLAFVVDILKPIGLVLLPYPICFDSGVDPYIAAATIIPLINDTLVFLAITWRLSRFSYNPLSLRGNVRLLIFGDYLPVFSKVLLRDGQAYYLLAICLTVLKNLTFLPQDHRYRECRNSGHVICFDPWHYSNNRRGSKHRSDECHGLSSIQEHDTIRNLERERASYHLVSTDLKTGEAAPRRQDLLLIHTACPSSSSREVEMLYEQKKKVM